jgi:g-D-glutamyl-meso-diaminopimelate peptidase
MYAGFYDEPPTYENMTRAIQWLREEYPRLKVFPIGRSVLGREISALCIGHPAGATLFVGAVHGLEWLTSLLLIRFVETLLHGLATGGCVSDIDVTKALRSRSLVVIPCLNPDGVEIAVHGQEGAGERAAIIGGMCDGDFSTWQANANGVDLNHNFDAGWNILREMEEQSGVTGPAPTRYGGTHPHSEPESKAAVTFCLTYQPRTLYAFHSQGEEIYYRYGARTPTRSQLMAGILASSSGYTATHPEGLASHGGLKDWFITRFCRPGFTIEIGKGKNPLDIRTLPKTYARLEEMLMIATLL